MKPGHDENYVEFALMSHDIKTEKHYLDLHNPMSADKSFMGGLRLATRNILFLLLGLVSLGGFATLYNFVDQQMSLSLTVLKESRVVSQSVSELNRAIGDVRFYDRLVRDSPDNDNPQSTQLHRRAVDQVLTSLDVIQNSAASGGKSGQVTGQLSDAIGTIRDAFSSYGLEFSTMTDARNRLGLSRNTGLRVQRRDMVTKIRELFASDDTVQYLGLLRKFSTLDDRAEHSPVQASQAERAATNELYGDLIAGIEREVLDSGQRADLMAALQTHRGLLNQTIEVRDKLETPPAEIIQILDYIAPSVREVSDYGTQLLRISPLNYEQEYIQARKTLAAGSAIIIVVLVLAGLTLMRSITLPVTRLSKAVVNLAKGDRTGGIPLQGNNDEIGDMASAFDKWLDKLTEIDHLRSQLDDLRMRLSLGAIADGIDELKDHSATEQDRIPVNKPTDKLDDGPVKSSEKSTEIIPKQTPDASPKDTLGISPANQGRTIIADELPTAALVPVEPDTSPVKIDNLETIGTATRQLSQYNDSVTLAAKDVERTEHMINLLTQTTHQIEDLEIHISAIRDEANLLVFNAITPSITGETKTATATSTSTGTGTGKKAITDKGQKPIPPDTSPGDNDKRGDERGDERGEGRRFENLRNRVNRAEQIVDDLHRSLDKVNHIAHDIASMASSEALEATRKLMSQSERLQTMLDDLINKVGPGSKKTATNPDDQSD